MRASGDDLMGLCHLSGGKKSLVVALFFIDNRMVSKFRFACRFHVVQVIWLSFRLHGFRGFNLFYMLMSTDDEWLVAIAAMTLCALVMVTIWMIVFFIQHNRKFSQRRNTMETIKEILKPSSNGRSKKNDS